MKLLSSIWKFIEGIFSAPKSAEEPRLDEYTKPDLSDNPIIETNSTNQTEKKESGETILSPSLIKQAISHYNSVRVNDFVVKPSLPVLYFGDLKKYLASEPRVVTVSLNPSSVEFIESEGEAPSFFRFPGYEETAESLEYSLSNYFKVSPYTRWFGKKRGSNSGFLPVLEGMGFSYYEVDNKQTALHTDLCSPIATNPTWSGLKHYQQDLLLKEGFQIWKKLIGEIKPNIIVMSTSKKYLEWLNPTFVECLKYKESSADQGRTPVEYTVDYYEVEIDGFKTNLVWGSSQNTPFMPFSDKREIGKKIISSFNNRKSVNTQEEYLESELEEAQAHFLTEDGNHIKKRVRSNPLNEHEFYQALSAWKNVNPDPNALVGGSDVGVSPLIYVRVNGVFYKLHSDAKGKGVSEFLLNKGNPWVPAEGRQSTTNRIDKKPIKGFYLYKVD